MRMRAIEVRSLEIPFKKSFNTAEIRRQKTSNLIIKVELKNGTVGFGEGVPREYVTGETIDNSTQMMRDFFIPYLIEECDFSSFEEGVEFFSNQEPCSRNGVVYNATRCSLETGILDAFGKNFGKNFSAIPSILGINCSPQLKSSGRYSYVFSMGKPKSKLLMKGLFYYGFRDFKFKIDENQDYSQIDAFIKALKRKINSGEVCMRADGNCAFNPSELEGVITELDKRGIYYLEQPLPVGDERSLIPFKEQYAIILDESLCSMNDAEQAIREGYGDLFNIRISKNGGIIQALKMRDLALRNGINYQLGCHPGETGILTAVGVHFIRSGGNQMFSEGAYGTHLLQEDITKQNMTFGFGAKIVQVADVGGTGVNVDERKLKKYSKRLI